MIEKPLLGSDRNILVVGDSTGDETNETAAVFVTNGEWVFRWAEQLAVDNPTAYVEIRSFKSLVVYRSPIVVQDGAGPVIRIWNGSIAGSQPTEALGMNFEAMIRVPPLCDTVIINHGYNPQAAGNPDNSYASQMIPLIETLKAEHPDAHMFLVRQPRSEVGTLMDAWVDSIDVLATLYGCDTLDVWQQVQDFGGDKSTLYADGLHPTEAGVDEWISKINSDYAAALPLQQHGDGFVETIKTNLLVNGGFKNYPTGWTEDGAGTIGITSSEVDSGAIRSLTIEDTGSTTSKISQSIDATSLQGKTATLTVRRYIEGDPEATPESRLVMSSDGTGTPSTFIKTYSRWTGGWHWACLQLDVPNDATTVTIELHGRFAGSATKVHYAFATLVEGDKVSTINLVDLN